MMLASTLAEYIFEKEKMTVEEAFDVIATQYDEMSLFDFKSALARMKICNSPAEAETLYRTLVGSNGRFLGIMDKRGTGRVSKADWCHVLSSAYSPPEHSAESPRGDPDLSFDVTKAVPLWGDIALFRGDSKDVELNKSDNTIKFTRFSTFKSSQSCSKGQWGYYEIELLSEVELPQFGFASADFKSSNEFTGIGVGDEPNSWGVDGQRQKKWHNEVADSYPCQWKKHDVVGLACDLEKRQIFVSVNGNYETFPPSGLAFEIDEHAVESGIFAAFTLEKGTIRYNLGGSPFKYEPPYEKVCNEKVCHENIFLVCDQGHSDVEQRKGDDRNCCDTCLKRKLADTCCLREGGTNFWCSSCDASLCIRWISGGEHEVAFHRTSEERRARTLRVFAVALSVQCRDALSNQDFFDDQKADFPVEELDAMAREWQLDLSPKDVRGLVDYLKKPTDERICKDSWKAAIDAEKQTETSLIRILTVVLSAFVWDIRTVSSAFPSKYWWQSSVLELELELISIQRFA